jgi:hypothetical protein
VLRSWVEGKVWHQVLPLMRRGDRGSLGNKSNVCLNVHTLFHMYLNMNIIRHNFVSLEPIFGS